MESSPRFILPPRPQPPEAGTEEHERWCRDSSIVYENGSLTSAYGNWVQLWAAGELPAATIGKDVSRASYTAKRTNKIGGTEKSVTVPASTYKKYPKQNSSSAAAGEVFTFVTDDGDFTARVTGDIQHVVKEIAANRSQQYITFTMYSNRGAQYGPFTPLVINPS
jgi:hypothetical protein